MKIFINNLPLSILNSERFFPTNKDKDHPMTGWNKPEKQMSYSKALKRSQYIGFDIAGHDINPDYLVLDWDNVINPETGEWISLDAKLIFDWIVKNVPTFIERSISGKGLHMIFLPTPENSINLKGWHVLNFTDGNEKSKLEIFYKTGGRYFLFTGDCYECKPNAPIASGEPVDKLISWLLKKVDIQNKKLQDHDPALIYDSRVDSHYSDKDPADNISPAHMKHYSNSHDDLDNIKDALNFIPADLPYQDWLNVLMAAHSFDSSPSMMSIMDEWSKTAPNVYKDGDVAYKWQSFNPSDGITIATLFDYAKKYGYVHKNKKYSPPKKKNKPATATAPVLKTQTSNDDDIINEILASLQRDKKGEKILPNTYNFELILKNDPLIKDCVGYDLFNQTPTRLKKFPWSSNNLDIDSWRDVDDASLQNYIALTYGIRNQAVFNTTLLEFIHMHHFHPVQDYFNNLPQWDEFPRAETIFIDGLNIPDTRYSRITTRHWLLAAVSRIFHPGCKWDCVLTIKSPQGSGKSTIFNRLGVNWFTDSIGSLDGKDALEQLQGNWIIELAELQATKQSENEQIKAFLSRKVDKFRKSYGHNVESYPRQCVFCGSTNSEEFLKDHTGGRRFLLLISTATADTFDKRMKGLTKEYVNKIWAEVFHWYKELFGENGENFDENLLDIPQDIKMEAVELQNKYTEGSTLEATVTSFLEKKIPRENFWKVMNKRERRAWMNGELKSIDSDRVGEDGSYTALKEEEERYKVCAAEIAYEAMNIDNPGEPKNRLLIRQINEILSRLPDWQRAQAKFGVRFGDYGRQKISFMKKWCPLGD